MGSVTTLSFITAAGFLFMSANLVLKLMGHMPVYVLYPAVGVSILAGCWFQAAAFRETQFGLVVVMVLGLEMLFSVLVARAFLGEIYSPANLAGVMLVIAGMALVHLPATAQVAAEEKQDAFPHVNVDKGPRPLLADAAWDR